MILNVYLYIIVDDMEIDEDELLGIREVSNSNPPRDASSAIDSLTDGAGIYDSGLCALTRIFIIININYS